MSKGYDRDKNRNDRNGGIKIPGEVKSFAFTSFKKFRKENPEYSKKEAKEEYWYLKLTEGLPATIDFLCAKGHIQNDEIQEIKNEVFRQFADPEKDLLKHLTKFLKDYESEYIENLIYLPILLRGIIKDMVEYEKDPECMANLDPTSLSDLCEKILKKRLKKLTKNGIPSEFAYDILLVVPEKDAITKYGGFARARQLFDVLYFYAEKNYKIDPEKLFDLITDDEGEQIIIGFALQERREKTKTFNENQMAFFVNTNGWIFDTMENIEDHEIRRILTNYIRIRKRDAANGKDGNRRYFLNSLPEDDYPNIVRIIKGIKAKDPEAEKFL